MRGKRKVATPRSVVRRAVADAAELVWRRDCMGCARVDVRPVAAGIGLCRECALELRRVPERVDGVERPPVTASGPYGGVHRAVVLAAKDHHRQDAVEVLGDIFAAVVRHLVALGELPDPRTAPLILLPAPTRPSTARERGGCVVARGALAAARQLGGDARCVQVASLAEGTPDSVGLSRAARAGNVARAVRFREDGVRSVQRALLVPGTVACVVDDVCTTGATLAGFSLGLSARGVVPRAGIVAARA